MAAIDDTAPPLARDKSATLRLRVVSALALAPVAIAAIWFGSPWFPALILLAAAVLGWEWGRLCGRGTLVPVIIGAALLAGVLAAVGHPVWALAGAAAGAAAASLVGRQRGEAALAGLGTLWIAVPSIALIWLDREPGAGRAVLLWLFVLVWATDTGAYLAGRSLGGPRLAPRTSPNKTLSGLCGGIASAVVVGLAAASLLELPARLPLAILSAALAIVAQAGDLAESAAKRHFGVKDASGLIPGHGGLLDRVDGLLAVAPVVALATFIGGSVLTW